MRIRKISKSQKKVLDYLKDYFKTDTTTPSHADIAKETGLNKSTVCDAIRSLESKGFLERVRIETMNFLDEDFEVNGGPLFEIKSLLLDNNQKMIDLKALLESSAASDNQDISNMEARLVEQIQVLNKPINSNEHIEKTGHVFPETDNLKKMAEEKKKKKRGRPPKQEAKTEYPLDPPKQIPEEKKPMAKTSWKKDAPVDPEPPIDYIPSVDDLPPIEDEEAEILEGFNNMNTDDI